MRRRGGVRDGNPDRQHTFDRQPGRRQRLGQRSPLHQLHRQEDRCARIFDGVDGDDVRVIERGHGERFAREALAAIGVDRCDVGEHFECDLALQSRIAGPIDLAHPAGAEQRHDFLGTELLPGLNGMAQIMAAARCSADKLR